MWVADDRDDRIYAYDMASKARVSTRDFTTLRGAGNTDPSGIYSDGATLWVADTADDKLYAYDLGSKARVPAKEVTNLSDAGNADPYGIWADGTTLWVADTVDDKLYAYDTRNLIDTNSLSSLSTKLATIAAAADLIVSLNTGSTAVARSSTITLTATVSYTGASASTTLRWYRSTDSTISSADMLLGSNALSNLGAGTNVTISNTVTIPNAYATYYYGACVDPVADEYYSNNNCSSVRVVAMFGARLSTRDFTTALDADNNTPVGIWSDGTNMWVADGADNKIYAYWLSNKARNSNEDFNTLASGGTRGIWSDGTTMWVVDNTIGNEKIYAYWLSNKARNPNEDFTNLNAANRSPRDLWSDGTTMWLADQGGAKLYAYDMESKAHVPTKDFDPLASGHINPAGIWSDGTTMWVVGSYILVLIIPPPISSPTTCLIGLPVSQLKTSTPSRTQGSCALCHLVRRRHHVGRRVS